MSTKLTRAEKASTEVGREELERMHAYWRAANYLSVGQIYLLDNPLSGSTCHPTQILGARRAT